MVSKLQHIRNTVICTVLLTPLFTPVTVSAEMIDSYLGMNFVNSYASVSEVQLQKLTYIGANGASITVAIPELIGNSPFHGTPLTGLPDGLGITAAPTYTTLSGGDGETTRSFDQTVAIDWDTSGDSPTIQITDIEVNVPGIGVWGAQFETPYAVGLVPATQLDDELNSTFESPAGDIYSEFVGSPGNDVGTVIATSAPPGFEGLIGVAFGDFIFSAAWAADSADKIGELVVDVVELNAKQGITSSLDAKLETAIKTIEDVKQGNKNAVIGKLDAFINEVNAQSDKNIPKEKAEKLAKKAHIIKCGGSWGRYGWGGYPGYGGWGDGYGYGYGGPYGWGGPYGYGCGGPYGWGGPYGYGY